MHIFINFYTVFTLFCLLNLGLFSIKIVYFKNHFAYPRVSSKTGILFGIFYEKISIHFMPDTVSY